MTAPRAVLVRPGFLVRAVVYTPLALLVLSIALPWCGCRGRGNADESAAIATMKMLCDAQLRFRELAVLDADGDGLGEFGTFDLLAGPCTPEGHPLLSSRFRRVSEDGVVQRSSFLFRIHLPRRGGGFCREGEPFSVDPDGAEQHFLAFAWPAVHQLSPTRWKRVFALDETGTLWAYDNPGGAFQGDRAPPPDLFPRAGTTHPWRPVR